MYCKARGENLQISSLYHARNIFYILQRIKTREKRRERPALW